MLFFIFNTTTIKWEVTAKGTILIKHETYSAEEYDAATVQT